MSASGQSEKGSLILQFELTLIMMLVGMEVSDHRDGEKGYLTAEGGGGGGKVHEC